MRRNSIRAVSLLGLALMLALPPTGVRAEPGDDTETNGWSWDKFFDYSACVLAIGLAASGPPGVTLAVFACGRVMVKYATT
jgi:hypothetical protein